MNAVPATTALAVCATEPTLHHSVETWGHKRDIFVCCPPTADAAKCYIKCSSILE